MMGVPGPIDVNPETVEHCERILDRAEARLFEIFPRIKRATSSGACAPTIAHTAKITGKKHRTGECIGLGQHVGQTGVHRPTNRTPVSGLWLVGGAKKKGFYGGGATLPHRGGPGAGGARHRDGFPVRRCTWRTLRGSTEIRFHYGHVREGREDPPFF